MLSWSAQRKLIYLIGSLAVLFVLIYVPFLLFWHNAPTCSDKLQNGDETGVDCGGGCSQICIDTAVDPLVLWSRVFRVVPQVYSAVAYVENPNPNSEAPYAEYEFTFYDDAGNEIMRRTGATFIPQGQRFAVFEGVINFGTTTPARSTFSFTNIPNWRTGTALAKNIVVRNKALLREDTAPRIDATVSNQSQVYIPQAELVSIIYDALGKAVAASRTIVEDLSPGETQRVTFSWPQPFETSVSVCESPVDVALLIDRSGSMDDDGTDPPEPLTSVKAAAHLFIKQLAAEDRVSVISFDRNAQNHIATGLTFDKEEAERALDTIAITASSSSYTNIAGGLDEAVRVFDAVGSREGTRRAIVLLTDGMPTAPGESDTAAADTVQAATTARGLGLSVYAIGLGTSVDRKFLESLVSDPASYRGVVQTEDLNDIYTSLATEICARRPAVIEIIPRIPSADGL